MSPSRMCHSYIPTNNAPPQELMPTSVRFDPSPGPQADRKTEVSRGTSAVEAPPVPDVLKYFYHKGTRKNDRVHRESQGLRFARSANTCLLCGLGRSSLFLCDKNTLVRARTNASMPARNHTICPPRRSRAEANPAAADIEPGQHSAIRPVGEVPDQRSPGHRRTAPSRTGCLRPAPRPARAGFFHPPVCILLQCKTGTSSRTAT